MTKKQKEQRAFHTRVMLSKLGTFDPLPSEIEALAKKSCRDNLKFERGRCPSCNRRYWQCDCADRAPYYPPSTRITAAINSALLEKP